MEKSDWQEELRKLDRGEKVKLSGTKKFLGLRIDWHLNAFPLKEERNGSGTNTV